LFVEKWQEIAVNSHIYYGNAVDDNVMNCHNKKARAQCVLSKSPRSSSLWTKEARAMPTCLSPST
jgi:hypothetical protein